MFGWREVVKGILPQIAAAMAASLIGLPMVPVLIIAAIIQGGFTTFNLLNRIKEETIKGYRAKLRELAADQADKIAQQIDSQLSELQGQIDRGIQAQIDSVKEQVEAALATQQKGEAEVNAKLTTIYQTEQHLAHIGIKLVKFIQGLDQPDKGGLNDDLK